MFLCLKNHEIITDVSVSNYLACAGHPTHKPGTPSPRSPRSLNTSTGRTRHLLQSSGPRLGPVGLTSHVDICVLSHKRSCSLELKGGDVCPPPPTGA